MSLLFSIWNLLSIINVLIRLIQSKIVLPYGNYARDVQSHISSNKILFLAFRLGKGGASELSPLL